MELAKYFYKAMKREVSLLTFVAAYSIFTITLLQWPLLDFIISVSDFPNLQSFYLLSQLSLYSFLY